MPNDIRIKHVQRMEGSDTYSVDIVINGVTVNGLDVTFEDNGTYIEAFFKAPQIDDGFGEPMPTVEFPVDTEIEIRERLKEAMVRNGKLTTK
jgi:hypothetical protein